MCAHTLMAERNNRIIVLRRSSSVSNKMVPVRITMTHNVQRKLNKDVRQPAAAGPRMRPRLIPKTKSAMAPPRSSALYMSLTLPPPMLNWLDPAKPVKKRKTSHSSLSFAALVARRLTHFMFRRPESFWSEQGVNKCTYDTT